MQLSDFGARQQQAEHLAAFGPLSLFPLIFILVKGGFHV